jgi:DNA invertase Pin-like site-specific DNA recombinase
MKEARVAAIYARVSTSNNGQDPTMQTRELREYCKRRGWKVFEEYVDRGFSGAKDSRPALDQMMADAYQRKFSAIIVWKFDRFARSVSHLLRALETFKSLGIEFVSLSEQMDTTTPAGKMIFTVLGAVAELERALTVERVKAGIRNAKAKGKRIGRPPLRTFSEEEIRAIRKARRNERVSVRQLAKTYGTTQWMIQRLADAA